MSSPEKTGARGALEAFLPDDLRARLREAEARFAASERNRTPLYPVLAQLDEFAKWGFTGHRPETRLVDKTPQWMRRLLALGDEPLAPWIAVFALTLEMHRNYDRTVRKALADLCALGARVLPPIMRALGAPDVAPDLRRHLWAFLHQSWKTEVSAEPLASSLSASLSGALVDESPEVARAARGIARAMGPRALEAIDIAIKSAPHPKRRKDLTQLRAACAEAEPDSPAAPARESLAPRPPLEMALASLRLGSDRAALEALLTVWRTSRAPAIADLVEQVGERVDLTEPALEAASVNATQARWLERARGGDPARLGRLLATPWPKQWADGTTRLKALQAFPPDPRVATALRRVIESRPYDSGASFPFYRHALSLLDKIDDHRVWAPLDALYLSLENGWLSRQIRDHYMTQGYVNRRADRVPEPLGGDDAASVRAIAEHLAGGRRLIADLTAAIYARPDDEAVYLVLADALSEAGDPRGELIALQCERAAGRGSAEAARRERALLEAHEDGWLDGLPLLRPRRFERGFVVAGTASLWADATRAHRPAWGLIEELTLSEPLPGAGSFAAFVDATATRLRAVRGATLEIARALGDRERASPIETLEWTAHNQVELPPATGLPALRRIVVRGKYLRVDPSLMQAPLWAQLTTAAIEGGSLQWWLGLLSRPPARLEELRIVARSGWEYTIRRGGGGGFSAVEAAWIGGSSKYGLHEVADALNGLPAGALEAFRIAPSRALASDVAPAEPADDPEHSRWRNPQGHMQRTLAEALSRFPRARVDLPWM